MMCRWICSSNGFYAHRSGFSLEYRTERNPMIASRDYRRKKAAPKGGWKVLGEDA